MYACAPGSFCQLATLTCVDNSTIVHAAEGEPCDLFAEPTIGCVGDLYCKAGADGGSRGICTRAPAAEQPCAGNGPQSEYMCAAGTTCNAGICERPGFCGLSTQCDSASYCASATRACAPRAEVGQSCYRHPVESVGLPCRAPAVCGSEQTCVVPRARGEACDNDNPCEELLFCVGGTCQPMAAGLCPA
jgi:hypothetical protein